MNNCLFCKIANKEIKSDIVKENKNIIAFKDVNPISPEHILIIPKVHLSDTSMINEQNSFLFSEMALMANEIIKDFNEQDNGCRWVINTGKNGGQSVFHIHLHLIMGRKFTWPPG